MTFVTVNGLRLHVQELGRPGAPPGVHLHGQLTGNVASWYFGLGPALAATNHVRMYDQRGHGRSERPAGGYRLDDLAADLDVLTADLGPAVLVGHSFGGVVALRRALDHPDRVAGVVTVDSFATSDAVGDTLEVGDPAGSGNGPVDGLVRAATSAPVPWTAPAGGRPPGRRRRAGWEELLTDTSLVADLAGGSRLPAAGLAALDVPVLSVVGSASPFREEVERLAASLPPATTTVVVLDGGHAVHLDAPRDLEAAVVGFVAATGHPGAPRR